MRIVAFALSAVLLSGCSWLGNTFGAGGHYKAKSSQYGHNAYGGPRHANPCEIPAANHPIPHGCDPAQVTIGTGGFPQQPVYGQGAYGGGQYAQAGYGSHAHDAQSHANYRNQKTPRIRKPKWRGQLSYGVDTSKSGTFIDSTKFIPNYNPADYNVINTTNPPQGTAGDQVVGMYSGGPTDPTSDRPYDRSEAIDTSFDDIYQAPSRLALGGEYILDNKTTLFAEIGYTQSAAGNFNGPVDVYGSIDGSETTTPVDAAGNPTGPAVTNDFDTGPNPDPYQTRLARFSNYDLSDMKRLDFQFGGRRYFNSIIKSANAQTLTPFVGASAGVAYHDDITFSYDLEQTNYDAQHAILAADPDSTAISSSPVDVSSVRETLYESQWVPTGQLSAGLDWQLTPRTALAFETGIKVEGARDYANGEKGDTNIIVPFTLRGSYNF